MHRQLTALLLSLGLCTSAQATILSLENTFSSIVGSATTVAVDGTLDEDDFSDDHPLSSLPLSGAASASTPDGTSAVSSAFVDEDFVLVDTEVFDADESAEASSFADFNAQFTGNGGGVTLFIDVDHQADASGSGALTDTELSVQVFGPGGISLVDLFLPLGADNVLAMFDPTFTLAAGAVADLVVSVFAESSSELAGEAFSTTAIGFQLVAAAVSELHTLKLMLLGVVCVGASRKRIAT